MKDNHINHRMLLSNGRTTTCGLCSETWIQRNPAPVGISLMVAPNHLWRGFEGK